MNDIPLINTSGSLINTRKCMCCYPSLFADYPLSELPTNLSATIIHPSGAGRRLQAASESSFSQSRAVLMFLSVIKRGGHARSLLVIIVRFATSSDLFIALASVKRQFTRSVHWKPSLDKIHLLTASARLRRLRFRCHSSHQRHQDTLSQIRHWLSLMPGSGRLSSRCSPAVSNGSGK